EVQGEPGMIAIDPGKRAGGMVAQGDKAESQGASTFSVGVAVPMKVVVVDDGAVEGRTILSRQNDHRRRLDQRPRRNRCTGEHPTAAPRARADFDSIVRNRRDAAARRRRIAQESTLCEPIQSWRALACGPPRWQQPEPLKLSRRREEA